MLIDRIHTLTQDRKNFLYLTIGASLSICLTLLAGRMVFTGSLTYIFLAWNLFLALVPFVISNWITGNEGRKMWILLSAIAAWLVFLPNSPYLITDFVHLRPRAGAPYWFDICLLSFFAWNGLMLGYLSLIQIHKIVEHQFSATMAWGFVFFSMFASGFGIYIGRFLRWNSWDVIRSPFELAGNLIQEMMHPLSHPRGWAVTVVFGGFMILGYLMIRAMVWYGSTEPAVDSRHNHPLE
jgi:uncharacterized membrane protein